MKKGIYFIFFILFASNVYSGEVVKIAIGNWEPFTSKRDKNANMSELIVREAFKLENIDVQFEYFPWKRSYENVLNARYIGTFPWAKTEEREKNFIINKEPIFKEKTVFFHLKDLDFTWNTYDDLKKYRVGGVIGYFQAEMLEKHGVKIDYVGTEDLNYKKVLKRRIQIYPTSFFVGYFQINKLFGPVKSALFTNHPKPLTENNFYMLFSKKHPDSKVLSDKLDNGLKKLKAGGQYEKIVDSVLF